MVVKVFSLSSVLPDPLSPLEINILDQEGVEGIYVSGNQVPFFLNLTLNLKASQVILS